MNADETLKWQRIELLTSIRMADDSDELRKARNTFEMVRPWWRLAGFGAAVQEVTVAIRMKALDKHAEETAYLNSLRKNAMTRNSTEKQIKEYTEIFQSMRDE